MQRIIMATFLVYTFLSLSSAHAAQNVCLFNSSWQARLTINGEICSATIINKLMERISVRGDFMGSDEGCLLKAPADGGEFLYTIRPIPGDSAQQPWRGRVEYIEQGSQPLSLLTPSESQLAQIPCPKS